jgi:hypothetical protein
MKAFLMYRDRDFDPEGGRQPAASDLAQDLGLHILFTAMAADDRFLYDVAGNALLSSLDDPDEIRYRQQILADCLEQPALVREIYAIAVDAIMGEKRVWGSLLSRLPESLLHRSVDVLQMFAGHLRRLRGIADEHSTDFRSEGFRRFFEMISSELDDAYLASVDDHLERLRFRAGVVMSGELGTANRGANYVLRRRTRPPSWRDWLPMLDRSGYVYEIPGQDEAGVQALGALKGRGISLAAIALAQSTDHILSFFSLLRTELAFYVGCMNLHARLAAKGDPICFPAPTPAGHSSLSCRGLYDVCLSLSMADRVVGNDLSADLKALVVVTGANRGGKSTFLRSVGLAQLMMQCGMFVPAESFTADVRDGIFSHFKREEDPGLRSGKLDEELKRMSSIVDRLSPNSLVLLNESFASTNEREGSQIAREIIRAMLEAGVKVVYVSHMFDLARGFYRQGMAAGLFLRAERIPDGTRTFRVIEGEPLPTSFGEDVYRRVFGWAPESTPPAAVGGVG